MGCNVWKQLQPKSAALLNISRCWDSKEHAVFGVGKKREEKNTQEGLGGE